jgi:hypothetical protein
MARMSGLHPAHSPNRARPNKSERRPPGQSRDRRIATRMCQWAVVVPVRIVDGSSFRPGPWDEDTDIFWM